MTDSTISFPKYIGYGLQEKDSYQFNPDTGIHSCRYHFNGTTIIEAEISEQNASIREIYKGAVRGSATDVTLEKAVINYYSDQECLTNPIYFEWVKQIIDIGNIYVEMFNRLDFPMIFFSTVYFTTIHIPLKPEKEIIARKIFTDIDYDYCNPWVQQATMETEYYDKTVEEKISFLSLTSPIAYVPYALKKLVSTGVIDDEKRYRAVVTATEFYHSGRKRKFLGNDDDNWMAYSIEYQPLKPSIIPK
jgi:hypothetical protein